MKCRWYEGHPTSECLRETEVCTNCKGEGFVAPVFDPESGDLLSGGCLECEGSGYEWYCKRHTGCDDDEAGALVGVR